MFSPPSSSCLSFVSPPPLHPCQLRGREHNNNLSAGVGSKPQLIVNLHQASALHGHSQSPVLWTSPHFCPVLWTWDEAALFEGSVEKDLPAPHFLSPLHRLRSRSNVLVLHTSHYSQLYLLFLFVNHSDGQTDLRPADQRSIWQNGILSLNNVFWSSTS